MKVEDTSELGALSVSAIEPLSNCFEDVSITAMSVVESWSVDKNEIG